MQTAPELNRIDIVPPAGAGTGIYSLFSGYGFFIDVPAGTSIGDLLRQHLGLAADDIENHVKTILYDGRPVDDVEGWRIEGPSTIALSGALPGLFGAAFRRQGKYAALRPRCAPDSIKGQTETGPIQVTIKLFNLCSRTIGPKLLQNGIKMPSERFISLWKNILNVTGGGKQLGASLDGNAVSPESLAGSIPLDTVHVFVHPPD